MSNQKSLVAGALLASLLANQTAWAGMVTDSRGNVGYDTAAECDAAVTSGTARYYTPFTRKASSLKAGETRVRVMPLKNVPIPQDTVKAMAYGASDYQRGACDLGMGRKAGQNGVSKPLQGKYVPFSAEMPVNVYLNKQGVPVRLTMQQCDNRFAAPLPRPVPGTSVSIQPASAPAISAPAPVATAAATAVQTTALPAPVQAAVGLVQGGIGLKEVLGAAGVLAIGAILMNNNGDTGTTGTTGTN